MRINFFKSLTVGILLFTITSLLSAREIPVYDVNASTQSGGAANLASQPFQLEEGLYIMGPLDKSEISGTHYLLLDKNKQDEGEFIGVILDQSTIEVGNTSEMAFLFKTKKVRKGQTTILSPTKIDMYGLESSETKLDDISPHIEISKQDSNNSIRYPYLVQGKGLLNNSLLGMRKAVLNLPRWNSWPSTGVYYSKKGSYQSVINGNQLTVHSDSVLTYTLNPFNDYNLGRIATVSFSQFNNMGEFDNTSSEVLKIALFFEDSNSTKMFILATPASYPGRYNVNIYYPREHSFVDYWFPGKE